MPSSPFSFMKSFQLKSFLKYLPPLVLIVTLSVLYGRTLSPGLTWAHAGSDGGDLITAAATGGIAHPTGYPLYLVLARLFQVLPFGSLAYRTNLMSAFLTVLAAMLVYILVTHSIPRTQENVAWPGGLAAGYAFGLAPLVWSQAVITEVYALQACLVVLILYLYIVPHPASVKGQRRLDCWRGLVLGLAMGNHITAIFLLPPAILLSCLHRKETTGNAEHVARRWLDGFYFDGKALGRGLAWLGIGLSIYVSLPLRALAAPPVNWGNPVTLDRFWWLVSGEQYQVNYLPFDLVGQWERVQAWAALLLAQLGLPGLTCGLLGLVVFGRRSRLYLLTTWLALISSVFSILYRSADSYVYLIPFILSFAIWIGMGVSGLMQALPGRFSRLRFVFGILIAAYFLGRAAFVFKQMDASQDTRAENFGHEVLSIAPENALVFAKGDRAVFALWYFHFALEQRPDLAVFAEDLLHFDWYQETLRSSYPSLVVPGPLPAPGSISAANPARPVCTVRYAERTELECTQIPATP